MAHPDEIFNNDYGPSVRTEPKKMLQTNATDKQNKQTQKISNTSEELRNIIY
jgi:hypothetical protein